MSSIERVSFLGVTLPDLKLLVTMSRSRRGDVGKKSQNQRLFLVPMTKVTKGVFQESKSKYLHDLYDDFIDNKTRSKPNGNQSKIRKYFTNLTVRDKSEVAALIFETCGGG